jgi:hypothetical protein
LPRASGHESHAHFRGCSGTETDDVSSTVHRDCSRFTTDDWRVVSDGAKNCQEKFRKFFRILSSGWRTLPAPAHPWSPCGGATTASGVPNRAAAPPAARSPARRHRSGF